MSKCCFVGPAGERVQNQSASYLHRLITNPPNEFWIQGSGDATLEFETDDGEKRSLLILPNEEFGIYLHYLKEEGGRMFDDWLSLSDRNRLSEVVPCSDEWMASVGLFLPAESAAIAVAEFARSGQRSQHIDWIEPSELPEDGNW